MERNELLTLLKESKLKIETHQEHDLPLIKLFSKINPEDILRLALKQISAYANRFVEYFSNQEWPIKRVEDIARYVEGQDKEYIPDLRGSLWDDFYDIPRCGAFFMAIIHLETAIDHRREFDKLAEFSASAIESAITARTGEYWASTDKTSWEQYEQSARESLQQSDLEKIASGELHITIPTIPLYVHAYRQKLLLDLAKDIEVILLGTS